MTEITNEAARRLSALREGKRICEEVHADRLKGVYALYVGQHDVRYVRKATSDDIGFVATEAKSVVLFVASGLEGVVSDADINPTPTGVVWRWPGRYETTMAAGRMYSCAV